MNIAQIIRFNRPDMVAGTTGETRDQNGRGKKPLHGDGAADGSGLAEFSGVADGSGESEAGGGSAESDSAGGNGARSEALARAGLPDAL